MKNLIQGREHVFLHRDTKRVYTDVRHQFYYEAYELCQGPTPIQNFLMKEFNFSVNQGTIYHAWYKIKKKMEELTPRMFIKKYYGDEVVNGRGIEKLMDAYAAYQLSLHVENPTNPERRRIDIGRKVNELKMRASQ